MKRICLALVSAFSSWFSIQTFAVHSAIDPVPRTDAGWKTRHELINKRVSEAGEKAQVVFIGDSITQGWEGAGKDVWERNYSEHNAVNLGIGGDRTQHVLWRLDNGNLDGLNPKAAVVMIGTNNSNGEDNTAEQIAEGVRAIVEKLQGRLPEMKILLVAIFPRGENPNPQRGKILQANQIIRKVADGRNIIWVDFGHKFVDDGGHIPREIMPDYLHLSEDGYQIWAESIRGPLNRVLGQNQSSAAPSAGLSGDWIASLPGPNNERVPMPFSVQVDGHTITGNFHAEGGDLKIQAGHIDGNEFSWTVTRARAEGGTMTYKMTGKLEDGSIAGKASTNLEGQEVTVDWSAKRK